MIKKVAELIFTKDLREWLKFKAFNPQDKFIDEFRLSYEFRDEELKSFVTPQWIPMQGLLFSEESQVDVRLASKRVSLKEFVAHSNNNGQNLSGEDAEALYRFNGLVLLALDEKLSREFFEKVVDLWMDSYGNHSYAMGSYVISERLANLGVLVTRSKVYESWNDERKEKFHKSIVRDISYLARHLEYFGERLTGNHLSNNARGLMWGGYLNGQKSLIDKALEMMIKESERILEPEGLLREGSSNYQSLITRNYIEAHLLTSKRSNALFEIIAKLQKGIHLVKPQDTEVFIGDISPDFPQEYFDNIAYFLNETGEEKSAKGWMGHFVSSYKKSIHQPTATITGSFCRKDVGDISLLAHYNQSGFPILAGHAHCDSGSFVIVKNEKECLIDLGRLDYNDRNDQFVQSSSHNYVEINGTPAEIPARGVFGPAYIKKKSCEPNLELLEDGLKMTLNWKHFSVIHTRTVRVKNDQVVISDHFNGPGSHEINMHFHFPTAEMAQKISSGTKVINPIKVTRATDYGVLGNAYKVKIELGNVRLPYENVTVIDCSCGV